MTRSVLLITAITLLVGLPAHAQKQNEAIRLEALGALGGVNLYVTYSYIGATADSFVAKAYKAKQVRSLMGEVVAMQQKTADYLTKVANSGVAENDKQDLLKMVKVNQLLSTQAKALMDYAGTGKPAEAKRFEAARKSSWAEISVLLGIKK